MAALQCEICGGKLIGKPGGIFECDSCGTEYSTEWASAKIQEIKGTVKVEGTVQVAGTVTIEGGISIASLLKRGELALEDREWDNARKAFDRALDMDPENGHAYFGKLMAEYRVRSGEELSALSREFTSSANYQKALRFADEALSAKLEEILKIIEAREEVQRREKERREQLAREKAEEDRKKAKKQARKIAHAAKIAVPILAVLIALAVVIPMLTNKPEQGIPKATEVRMEAFATEAPATEETEPSAEAIQYSQAEAWEDDGQLGRAAIAFGKLGDYRDARERSLAIWEKITPRNTVACWGQKGIAAIMTDGTVMAGNKNELYNSAYGWENITSISSSSHPSFFGMGLKTDGTVAVNQSVSKLSNVSKWTDIVAVERDYGYSGHIVGLKTNGTVVAAGDNAFGQCDVSDWTDIISVTCHSFYGSIPNRNANYMYSCTFGLKCDGTVVVTGDPWCDLSDWTDIVALSISNFHVVGLKPDGTVVAVGYQPDTEGILSARYELSGWQDIIAIDTTDYSTFGLKSDGTMVVAGNPYIFRDMDVSDWTDIVAFDATGGTTVGLKSDGTMVAVGTNQGGNCEVSGWQDIVAFAANEYETIGLKSDGTLVAVGTIADVNRWNNTFGVKLPTKLLPARNGNENKE